MLRINPFAALRPRPELADQVASVPFDVVDSCSARRLAQGNDLSFLHVLRPEIDLPLDVDIYSDRVYEKAAENLQMFKDKGVLIREESPCIYLYRLQTQIFGSAVSQTGVVCCCHIDDYQNGLIKKHEKTRKHKEDDRTRHILTINAHAGPVFLMFRNQSELKKLNNAVVQTEPLYDFVAPDSVHHTIWRVDEYKSYVEAFSRIGAAYVADGHHRSASAARAGLERRRNNPDHKGDEEYNWYLTVLFPAEELTILPSHRLIRDMNGLGSQQLLEKLERVGLTEQTHTPAPEKPGSFGMYLDRKWYRITLPEESIQATDPVNCLDYVLLDERILHPILNIGDTGTDKRVDFVGGIDGLNKLQKKIDSGEYALGFAMHAVSIDQLIGVADAGRIMPPKSTWFEPKLRSGLLIHSLD